MMGDESAKIDRRGFLGRAAAASLVTLFHREIASADHAAGPGKPLPGAARPRIAGLRLQTAAPLAEMQAFYGGRLGLPIRNESAAETTIAGGATEITFVRSAATEGRPFYHFAFNIPENKIRRAREWQLERSPLITTPPALRDAAYPDDVRHFRRWNAHSVFFWDPAGNLVEYIARHDLPNAADGAFTSGDILHVSEIGFIVEESRRGELARELREQLGWPAYRPEAGGFYWALGDEHGLALLLPRGLRPNVDHGRPVEFKVFPTEATLRARESTANALAGYPYRIKTAS